MVRVILLRPGATDFDEQRRIKGRLDIPLNPFGADQMARAANELADQSIEIVYASACQSAIESAALLGQSLGVKTRTLSKLQNLDQGLWQGRLIDEVKATQPKVYRQWQEQPDTVCPPEGEMLSDGRQRVVTSLEKLLKKHRKGVIAIVLPEPLATVAYGSLTNTELGDLWLAETRCGQWDIVDVETEPALTSTA